MLSNENLDFFSGIFIFNPLDDIYHLERIEKNITSICQASIKTAHNVKVVIALNNSEINIEKMVVRGVGEETRKLIMNLQSLYNFEIIMYNGVNANSRGYNLLLKYGHQKTDAKFITIFADDYIMPNFWYDLMFVNFKYHKDSYFMMPSTCFVAQENLRYEIGYHPDWDVRVAPKGDHQKWGVKTIYGGVEIEHINQIAKKFINNSIIPFFDPPSFETTVFKRELIDKVGYIHEEYHSCFYDNDYFNLISRASLAGHIAKNCFIFHYGKGGTKSLYSETADEKFIGSPVEHQLNSDVSVWNKRWNQKVQPWWGKK